MIILITINQKIEDWEKKGEILKNYFNRFQFFKEMYILSLVDDDKPTQNALEKLCGKKKFKFYSVKNIFLKNKLFKYVLPEVVYTKIIEYELQLINIKKPDLIRSIGDGYSGFVGSIIANFYKKKLVISIHRFVSFEIFFKYMGFKEKINFILESRFTKISHNRAKKILIVYDKIKKNIKKNYHKKIHIMYNDVYRNKATIKKRFKIDKKLKLVNVGRLINGKSPEIIINSLQKLENVELTVYGDGIKKNQIDKLIYSKQLSNKVFMKGFITNESIIKNLHSFDVFVGFDRFYEFPKILIEAVLSGLPIILNKNPSSTIKEFSNLKIFWVDENEYSYAETFQNILQKKYNLKEISINNINQLKKTLSSSYSKSNYIKFFNGLT